MSAGELILTEECPCYDEVMGASEYCSRCDGTGECVSEEGEKLLKFIRDNLFRGME